MNIVMRSSLSTKIRVGPSLLALAAIVLFAPCLYGQSLGGGGLSPEMERELEYADKLLAIGMAQYSQDIVSKLKLPPEIMDIRKVKNYCAIKKFDDAKKVIAKRGGDSQEAWTLKLTLADGYYMWGRYGEAQGIYDAFFAKFPDGPKPALKSFYMASAYKYSQMLLLMGNKKAAAGAYRFAVKAKPEKHIDRQLKCELAELLFQIAETQTAATRQGTLAEVQKLVDEILWKQDLWFGRAIVMLARMKQMAGDIPGAMALIDDYKEQLISIDKSLQAEEARTGDNLTKLSPLAQCRYMIGVIMHDEANRILKAGGSKQKALDLLIGKDLGKNSKGRSKRSSGALQHFLNVFIRYPNTAWAPDCGNRFREVEATLKVVFDKEIKAKITEEQWNTVEVAQFREARSLFNQQRFKEATETYEKVLSLFPERETSVSAMGELAACYIELEEYLLCDVVVRHLAERFCRHETLMAKAGDQVVRVAFKFSERQDAARMQGAYDVFFTYFKKHPRTSQELFRFAEEAFRADQFDKAFAYYEQIVADHKGSTVYFDALSKVAYVYGKQGNPSDEIKALKRLIDELKVEDKPGPPLISAMYRFANAVKTLGPKYVPMAITKYTELEKLLATKTSRQAYEHSAKDIEANIGILQGAIFYHAMADCMRKTVPANVQAAFDKKYKKKVPPELILKTHYKAGAIKRLLKLVDDFPDSPFAPASLSQCGALYTVLGKSDEARKTLQRLQKEYPDTPEAENSVFMIGVSLLELGMRREAITYFKEMFSGTGNYSAGQILRAGKELYDADEAEIAIEAFDLIIKTEKAQGFLEPARVGKGRALCSLKKYTEAADVLRAALKDYPRSGYTIELCRSASQAYAAVASELADVEARRALFDEAVVAMKRARKFSKDVGTQTELDVGVARIFERKAAAELKFGDVEKAEAYRNDAVAAYQIVIMFGNPNDKEVSPYIEDAYFYCLPLLLEMERWDDALQDAERYTVDFPKGKYTLKIRQYQNKARVSGGSKAEPEAADTAGVATAPSVKAEAEAEPTMATTPEEE
jgi:tetratricopeptide (TPR) repeat protein